MNKKIIHFFTTSFLVFILVVIPVLVQASPQEFYIYGLDQSIANNAFVQKTTDGGLNFTAKNNGIPMGAGLQGYGADFPLDANTGYFVGKSGMIYKTTNGGMNWVAQSSGTTQNLMSINCPVDAQTCYIAGYGPTVLKTTNGGANWVAQSLPSGTSFLSRVIFPNDNQTGFVAGYNGALLKTTNGGTNWVTSNSGIWSVGSDSSTILDIDFPVDNQNGFIATRSGIFKTTNGGANWNIIPWTANSVFSRVQFMGDLNNGFAVSIGAFSIADSNTKYYRLSNGGSDKELMNNIPKCMNQYKNGILQPPDGYSRCGFRSLYFINKDIGYLVSTGDAGKVDSYRLSGDGIIVFKTIDGGNNWIKFSNELLTAPLGLLWKDVPNTSIFTGTGWVGYLAFPHPKNQSPVASFKMNTVASDYQDANITGNAPLTVYFQDNSTDDKGITYRGWDFDNNGTIDKTGDITTFFTYSTSGAYTVKLTVADVEGVVSTITKTVTVVVASGTGEDLSIEKTVISGSNIQEGDYSTPIRFKITVKKGGFIGDVVNPSNFTNALLIYEKPAGACSYLNQSGWPASVDKTFLDRLGSYVGYNITTCPYTPQGSGTTYKIWSVLEDTIINSCSYNVYETICKQACSLRGKIVSARWCADINGNAYPCNGSSCDYCLCK